jgi:hypothetical protein
MKKSQRMKDKNINIKWLMPSLGIALVAGGLIGAETYVELTRKAHSKETFYAMLQRLNLDAGICAGLRALQEGDVNSAAQRLDRLLCDDILTLNSELTSLEGADRTFMKNAFARCALVRPTCAALQARTSQQPNDDEAKAERLLAEAARQVAPGTTGLAAVP